MILVRKETNPEDVDGMHVAEGISTGRGGMTRHAALVARGLGTPCVVGAGALDIDVVGKTIKVDGRTFRKGDVLTMNGTRGLVYVGELGMIDATENPRFVDFMKLADDIPSNEGAHQRRNPRRCQYRHRLRRRGHRPVPHRAHVLRHRLRGAAVPPAQDDHGGLRVQRVAPPSTSCNRFVKRDMKATMKIMGDRPVTFRLLDPPLHEFVPQNADERGESWQRLST